MAWYTVANVVSRAARELGLVSANLSDPYTSTDANILQLTSLLEALGQDLCRQHDWQQLRRIHAFATVASTVGYALPTDFLRFTNQTTWNLTQDLPIPAIGSVDWNMVQASSLAGTVYKRARVYQGKFYLIDTPSAAEDISYEYQSSYWVRTAIRGAWANSTAYTLAQLVTNDSGKVYYCDTAGTSAASPATGPSGTTNNQTDGTARWDYYEPSIHSITPTLEAPTAATDVLWFDLRLLVAGLKLYFRRTKGLDTTAEQLEFDRALDSAKAEGPANALTVGRTSTSYLLSDANLPETGVG